MISDNGPRHGRLAERVAIVTGGAGGIGTCIADYMSAEGAKVVLSDVCTEIGDTVASTLRERHRQVHFIRHDITSTEDWERVIDKTINLYGRLDILVNNAAVFLGKPLADTKIEEIDRVVQINIGGVIRGCQLAIPKLSMHAPSLSGGASIVNISSVAAMRGIPFQSIYCAAKAAVSAFTKAIAIECAALKLNIRANSVAPAVIDTQMSRQVIDHQARDWGVTAERAERLVLSAHPLGRLGTPADVAAAVVFLASAESAFITGTELIVDGGMTAR